MWIVAKHGFYSIIEDPEDSRYLIVRARIQGDIEKLFPGEFVSMDTGSDYKYRTWLKRGIVTKAVAQAIAEIDYDNFKASISDRRRHGAYFRIWLEMAALQQDALATEAGDRETGLK
jgi:hypothetical protein